MPRLLWVVACVICAGWFPPCGAAGQSAGQSKDSRATDSAIRALLDDRVAALGGAEGGVGIVVGIVTPQGRSLVSSGRLDKNDARTPAGDTVFEIGSVTKTFSALLLATMARSGEVSLQEPVASYLRAGTRIPGRNGRSITLADLATHTSGLPFMPDLPASTGSSPPPVSAAGLYRFLANYELTQDIGSSWDYSNLGYWLMSEALAARAGTDYRSLLHERVIAPMKLQSTAFELTASMRTRLAMGHDASARSAPAISSLPIYSLMPAAGGLYSTADDLLRFLALMMGYEDSPLSAAMTDMLSTRRRGSQAGVEHALGWVLVTRGDTLVFHDGGTLGYASCIAWDPGTHIGVVVLSNQVASVTDIARHVLRPDFPLDNPRVVQRKEITLSAAALDALVGDYDVPGEGVFNIVREGSALRIQSPPDWGLPTLQLHAESPSSFFATELPLRVEFQSDSAGRVTGMLLYPPRGQKAVPARRKP